MGIQQFVKPQQKQIIISLMVMKWVFLDPSLYVLLNILKFDSIQGKWQNQALI